MDTTTRSPRRNVLPEHEERLTFSSWDDVLLVGHPDALEADSFAAQTFLAPIYGPSGVLLLSHLVMHTRIEPVTFTIDELAHSFGLGGSKIVHALDRLAEFHVLVRSGNTVAVRRQVPLVRRQLQRLPDWLAATWLAGARDPQAINQWPNRA